MLTPCGPHLLTGAGGSFSYVPIKAVQQFSADSTICNGVYAWSLPLIKFTGKFKWSEAASRLTFGFDKLQVKPVHMMNYSSGNMLLNLE